MSSAILATPRSTLNERHSPSVHSVAHILHRIPPSWASSTRFRIDRMNSNRRAKNSVGMLDGGPSAVGGIVCFRECLANRVSSSPASKRTSRSYKKNRPGRLNKLPEACI